jgi:hypothetical protein
MWKHTSSQKIHDHRDPLRVIYTALCDAGMMNDWGFNFAVKIDFKGKRCTVKHSTAVITAAQVALNFARNLGRQTPFQVFANQPDCGLACHLHVGAPEIGPCYIRQMHAASQIVIRSILYVRCR